MQNNTLELASSRISFHILLPTKSFLRIHWIVLIKQVKSLPDNVVRVMTGVLLKYVSNVSESNY